MWLIELKHEGGKERVREGGERGRRICTLESSSSAEVNSLGEENNSTKENTLFAGEMKLQSHTGLVPAASAGDAASSREMRCQ